MSNNRELPPGWAPATIEDVFAPLHDGRTLHQGWSPQCDDGAAGPDEWGVLKTTAIQAGAFLDKHNKRLPPELAPRPGIEVATGDILITCAGPRSRCGIPALVRHTRPKLLMSGKMYRFRVRSDAMNPAFVEGLLLASDGQAAIDRMKTGGSDSGLNLTHERFRALPIVVAPTAEQNRIVDAIESYVSRLEAAVVSLERVQAKLNAYRATVLQAAVEGRLVPTEAEITRKEKCTYEPADALLGRILKERRRRWEEAELAKLAASGKTPKDDKWKEKYAAPEAPDTSALPQLPEGWCWTTADACTDPIRSITYGVVLLGDAVDDGVPTLRSSNVRHLWFESDYVKRISPDISADYRRTVLRGGEVLVTVRGTLGGVAVVPESARGWNISREVAMLDLIEPALARMVASFIASPRLQAWLSRQTKGNTYTGVNIENLKQLPIPLPPLAEADRIVDEIERHLSVAAAATGTATRQVNRCSRLRQSVLKWAFEGKLVDQDPHDEPAEVLLARIRAERTAVGTTKSARGRKAKPGSNMKAKAAT